MYAKIEKPKGNKSRWVTNSVAQKKSNGKQSFGFVDNRPQAIAQRKLQEMMNNVNGIIQCVRFAEALYVTSTQRGNLSFNLRNGHEYNLDNEGNAVTRGQAGVEIGASTNYKGEYLPKTHNRPIYMLANDPMNGAEVLKDNNPAGHRTIGYDAQTDGTETPAAFNTRLQGFGWVRKGEWKQPTAEKDSWTIE